jgi:hypothetical protein
MDRHRMFVIVAIVASASFRPNSAAGRACQTPIGAFSESV